MCDACKCEYTFSDPDFVDGVGMGMMSNKSWEIICSQSFDLISLDLISLCLDLIYLTSDVPDLDAVMFSVLVS